MKVVGSSWVQLVVDWQDESSIDVDAVWWFPVGDSEAGGCEFAVEGEQRLAPDPEAAVAAPAGAVPSTDHHPHVLAQGDPHRARRFHVAGAEAHRLQ